MKIKIDKEAGAAYIYLYSEHEGENLRSEPIDENIVLDYTQDGKLFGIEILSLSILDLEKLDD